MVGEKFDFIVDIVEEDTRMQLVSSNCIEVDCECVSFTFFEDCCLIGEVHSDTNYISFCEFE